MSFSIHKNIKVRNFIVVVTLLNLSFTFSFFVFPSFQCLYCISSCVKNFIIFLVARIFMVILFSFLKKRLYKTCKSHYRQLQVIIMIFNERALVNISSISNSKNPPWDLSSFVSRTVVNESPRNSVQNCFSFDLISNYW